MGQYFFVFSAAKKEDGVRQENTNVDGILQK
jgi:hypothetical protein